MRIKTINEKEGKRLGVKKYPIVSLEDSVRYKERRFLVKCGQRIYNVGGLEDDKGSLQSDGVKIYYFHAK